MGQELIDAIGGVSRRPLKHVGKIAVRIVTVEFRGLDETHDHRSASSGSLRPTEEPVGSPECHRSDPFLEPVVVDGQSAVVEVSRQCLPPAQAILDSFRNRRTAQYFLSVQDEPFPQRVGDRATAQLSQSLSTTCI